MDANPDLEFDFFLAAELGMTVDVLRRTMSAAEHVQWGVYYARRAQREELAAKGVGR